MAKDQIQGAVGPLRPMTQCRVGSAPLIEKGAKFEILKRRREMFPRFVTKTVHAYLDYPVAVSLMALPFVLGLEGVALMLAVSTGVAAFGLTLLTDHHLGVVRVIPYWIHVAVDRIVGLVFIAAPFVLGLGGLEAAFFWLNGAAVLTVTTLLNAPEPTSDPSIV